MASVDAEHPDASTPESDPGVRRPVVAILAVAGLLVVIDQLTKWWAVEALSDPSRIIDLFWTLRFRLIYNSGTAFSLTEDTGPIVSVVAVVVVIFLLRSGRDQRSRLVVAGYGLVVGGTIGNLIDRAFREGDGLFAGGVVDFVDPQWFPVFNVADAALTIGIGLVLAAGFFTDAFDPADDQGDS
ncbi:MAG: signal peptidase II [Acidimicrobiales bacterium]